MASQEQIIMSWQAPEFQHYPKNIAWYITLLVIAVFIAGFLVIQRDLFGALSIVILTIFVVVFSMQKPRDVTVTLTTKGIGLDESYIPYSTIRHFWVVDTDNHRTLNIETSAYLNRTVIIQLHKEDAEEIRDILSRLVPHHPDPEARETFAQRVMHRLKF